MHARLAVVAFLALCLLVLISLAGQAPIGAQTVPPPTPRPEVPQPSPSNQCVVNCVYMPAVATGR